MPIYEYRCSSCGHELESLQKFSDAPLVACPACHANALQKKVSAAGFHLKGSGWYVTDFKGGGAKPAAKSAESENKSGNGEGAANAAKSDSKSEASKASPKASPKPNRKQRRSRPRNPAVPNRRRIPPRHPRSNAESVELECADTSSPV
jgi:putative FmdB family regulatory protein